MPVYNNRCILIFRTKISLWLCLAFLPDEQACLPGAAMGLMQIPPLPSFVRQLRIKVTSQVWATAGNIVMAAAVVG